MPKLFNSGEVIYSSGAPDIGRTKEVDSHQLLSTEDRQDQIVTFDDIRTLGRLFLTQKYTGSIESAKPFPASFFASHLARDAGPFLAKLDIGNGTDPEKQFPVTVEVVLTEQGLVDLLYHCVPIHSGALEKAKHERHTDALLILAAASLVAPQIILAMRDGIETTNCSTKSNFVQEIRADHSGPLAGLFGSFRNDLETVKQIARISGDEQVTVSRATHIHGQDRQDTSALARAAAGTGIAAGVPVRSEYLSKLRPVMPHALRVPTRKNPVTGLPEIISISEALVDQGFDPLQLALVAAALGFTTDVVGTPNEQKVEALFDPRNIDRPIATIIRP
ncbi:MAG: hypothetical protein WAU07_03150 [Microgenomates group bacterium]